VSEFGKFFYLDNSLSMYSEWMLKYNPILDIKSYYAGGGPHVPTRKLFIVVFQKRVGVEGVSIQCSDTKCNYVTVPFPSTHNIFHNYVPKKNLIGCNYVTVPFTSYEGVSIHYSDTKYNYLVMVHYVRTKNMFPKRISFAVSFILLNLLFQFYPSEPSIPILSF